MISIPERIWCQAKVFNGDTGFDVVNPFTAKGFPIDELNRLALDRVKSIPALRAPTAAKALIVSDS